MLNYHLVILKKPYLDAILAGRKKIESRFSKAKPSHFGSLRKGDVLFLKVSSGPVRGQGVVAAVRYFENLTPRKIAEIRRRYDKYILGSEQYWREKAHCRFGFLVWLQSVQPIEPVRIAKRDWRAWVVLTEHANFGLLDNSEPAGR